MPELPKSVQVGPYCYTVKVDAGLVAQRSVEERADFYGHSHHRLLEIGLRPDMAPDQMADTMLHEVVHCVWRVAGLDQRKLLDMKREDDLEEAIVVAVSTLLLDTLRRNPELVAYVTSVTKEEDEKLHDVHGGQERDQEGSQ